ncbi:hypothetical protein GF378_02800 [Candidatus Pacearchaeota archaeon]|nr:hypothetical protein [Candidatus Pacearchaeota archaeon]
MIKFRKEAKLARLFSAIAFVLISVLLLVELSSAYHPICDPGDDADVRGVYIDGTCYDCGDLDEVCPEDYNVQCAANGLPDDDCVYIEGSFWSKDGSNPITETEDSKCKSDFSYGDKMYMVISGIELANDVRVNFTVREFGFGYGDEIVNGNIHANVSGGKVVGEWTIKEQEWIDAESTEFWFEAVAQGGYNLQSKSGSYGILILNQTFEEDAGINVCEDYTNEDNCTNDVEGVAAGPVRREDPEDSECYFNSTIYCGWDGENCNTTRTSEKQDPGNEGNGLCREENARDSCVYSQEEKIGNCEAGDQYFKVRYSTSDSESDCEPWETQPIPCPAKLRVPFFGTYSIIACISIIAIIYALINLNFKDFNIFNSKNKKKK